MTWPTRRGPWPLTRSWPPSSPKVVAASHRSGRSARRAGLEKARLVNLAHLARHTLFSLPRPPRTGCHVILMVLCARRSTRCGVVFLLSRGLSQVGSRSLWSRSWQTLCCRSWTGVQLVPRERVQSPVGKQMVDVPVPQIREEIVELVAGEVVCNARTGLRRQHGWTCTH